jgi:hypothetical protein
MDKSIKIIETNKDRIDYALLDKCEQKASEAFANSIIKFEQVDAYAQVLYNNAISMKTKDFK